MAIVNMLAGGAEFPHFSQNCTVLALDTNFSLVFYKTDVVGFEDWRGWFGKCTQDELKVLLVVFFALVQKFLVPLDAAKNEGINLFVQIVGMIDDCK